MVGTWHGQVYSIRPYPLDCSGQERPYGYSSKRESHGYQKFLWKKSGPSAINRENDASHSGYSSHADIGHQQQLPVTCPRVDAPDPPSSKRVSSPRVQADPTSRSNPTAESQALLPILLVNNHCVDLPGKDGSPPDCRLVGLRCYELWTMKYDSVTS